MNITIMHNSSLYVIKLCINLLSPILVILCELNCAAVEVYAVTL